MVRKRKIIENSTKMFTFEDLNNVDINRVHKIIEERKQNKKIGTEEDRKYIEPEYTEEEVFGDMAKILNNEDDILVMKENVVNKIKQSIPRKRLEDMTNSELYLDWKRSESYQNSILKEYQDTYDNFDFDDVNIVEEEKETEILEGSLNVEDNKPPKNTEEIQNIMKKMDETKLYLYTKEQLEQMNEQRLIKILVFLEMFENLSRDIQEDYLFLNKTRPDLILEDITNIDLLKNMVNQTNEALSKKMDNSEETYEKIKKRNEELGISLNLEEEHLYKMSKEELKQEKQKQKRIYESISKEKIENTERLNLLTRRIEKLTTDEKVGQQKLGDELVRLKNELTNLEVEYGYSKYTSKPKYTEEQVLILNKKNLEIVKAEKIYRETSTHLSEKTELENQKTSVKKNLDDLTVKEKQLLEQNKLITKVEDEKAWRESQIAIIESKVTVLQFGKFAINKMDNKKEYVLFLEQIRDHTATRENIEDYIRKLDELRLKKETEREEYKKQMKEKGKRMVMEGITDIKSFTKEMVGNLSQEVSQTMNFVLK